MIINLSIKVLIYTTTLSYIFFSCGNKSTKSEQFNNQTLDSLNSDNKFKYWLKDTLEYINSKTVEKNTLNGWKFVIANDSLSIEVIKEVEKSITATNTNDSNVNNILLLLKEYGELPKEPFTLRVTFYYYYYPSALYFPYAFTFEVKKLEVIENKKESFYNYIRGRLSGKTEKIKTNKNETKIRTYAFIWNNDKLVKTVEEE